MKSLSTLGLALSLIFGCLLLALLAELYYLLWWRKKIANRELEDPGGYGGSPAKELLYIFCWKKPSSLTSTAAVDPQDLRSDAPSAAEDWWPPETQLAGPPRFLFTIKEETKEDLESQDGKSRKVSRSRSLSDLMINVSVETPFLTPIASPPYFTPPLSPISFSGNGGFNPLFEASSLSPPPKLKFLKDAETKHHRRKLIQEAEEAVANEIEGCVQQDEENDSFITLVIDKNHSSSSHVHPLNSSPSSFRFQSTH